MADNSFTFWANMKEAIDVYEGNPEYQYRMYDALTEYALYGIWPEDDGSMETKNLIMFVQSMLPSIEKSAGFHKNVAESGSIGGRKLKVTDEQIESAIRSAVSSLKKVPTRKELVSEIKKLYGVDISEKTISRRISDDRKRDIAEGTLGQNGDKINVPGTKGQNRDITNVSEGQNKSPHVPTLFDF